MALTEPQITPNTFCTYTDTQNDSNITVFFISGNPGLISYYHPFLTLLAQNLAKEHDAKPSFQISGCSLGGFEIPSKGKSSTDKHLYSLEDQIRFVHQKLEALVHSTDNASSPSADSTRPKRKVILIGHSVGAYMAMEILRRHRDGIPSVEGVPESNSALDIIGGVMLFPTVKDIADSPSGQKLTKLLFFLPQLALVVGFLARILVTILPSASLRWIVRTVMKNPPPHALDTTVEFLKKEGGVRQALHMAADEMRTITTDKWTDDVWGVGQTREPVTRLFFYFGRNDHWVAEKTRDEIIAVRGQSGKEWRGPKMSVCEEGLPHAFCLKHNEVMARKVASMIQDIVHG